MKKWRFRNDMLLHEINSCSTRTFQDAENRLNYLEGLNAGNVARVCIVQIGESDENMVEMELTEAELYKVVELCQKIAMQTDNETLCAVLDKNDVEYFSNDCEWGNKLKK